MERHLRFKIYWASLIIERKFTVFALCLRVISKYKSPGGLYLKGRYTWRGLFSEFYGSSTCGTVGTGEGGEMGGVGVAPLLEKK